MVRRLPDYDGTTLHVLRGFPLCALPAPAQRAMPSFTNPEITVQVRQEDGRAAGENIRVVLELAEGGPVSDCLFDRPFQRRRKSRCQQLSLAGLGYCHQVLATQPIFARHVDSRLV